MKAMILAAGLGTRLKPLTDLTPKALIKIKDHTLLELQIKKLKSEGFVEIIINVHHFADQIINYLKKNNYFNCNIAFSDESKMLLDTGGGLKKASHFFSDGKPFLVYNVDIISDINLVNIFNAHTSSGGIATLAIKDRESSRKFLFNNKYELSGWMNEKSGEKILVREEAADLSAYAFSGIQIINPEIFKHFQEKDKFSLVELYLSVAKNEKILGFIHQEDFWLDLGKRESLAEAEKQFDKIKNIYPV